MSRLPSGTQTAAAPDRDGGLGNAIDEVEQEVARGESERTPLLLLGGVALAVAVMFAVAFLIVFLVWLLA